MLKKIFFTGILLVWVSVSIAKPVYLPNYLNSGGENALVERLAADKDFINYYLSNVEFANKIIETKSGSLFYKYIQNTSTEVEQSTLFKQMNVANKTEFDSYNKKRIELIAAFSNKFPDIMNLTDIEKKSTLLNAFKKIKADKTTSANLLLSITPEECFWSWAACTTSCFIACSYSENFSGCMSQCEIYCAGLFGICWMLSE